ncbi:MAG: mannose-1-phosphate guanylyltransferase [Bacteroidetes bacterium]|jgi:mannose-1-phosphate guanylyltransferase|nr:mannose-1-phosphate guanylyltransferase [Bacteroidota bacterium]
MNQNYFAVIMAGGIGSRFWPVSTSNYPKQFHDMLGTGQSLLQKTYARINKIVPAENIYILTNERYLQLTLEQLPDISEQQVVLEPAMRNTAPCILLAALKIQKQNPNALMLVAPSDHWIEDEEAYANDVIRCYKASEEADILMTLGILPTFPNTGYGYIESDSEENLEIKKVKQFREKPDYETAKRFLADGNFLWNAGIFIWSVKSIVNSYKTHLNQMYTHFFSGWNQLNTPEEKAFIQKEYAKAENISIDYGILEKAENVYVKPATFDWNDLGTWGALYDKLSKDEQDNATVNAKVLYREASNNIVFTSRKKFVVVEELNDYIIVDKEDVLLIYPKRKEQEIKMLINEVDEKYK